MTQDFLDGCTQKPPKSFPYGRSDFQGLVKETTTRTKVSITQDLRRNGVYRPVSGILALAQS